MILDDENEQELRNVLDTNFTSLLWCTKRVYAMLRDQDAEGHIVNINSIYGHSVPIIGHTANVYPATKHAMAATSEVLRHELNHLKNRKVRVSVGHSFLERIIIKQRNIIIK